MLDLTIVIPVKNEILNLPGCINAIGANFAKNIVILDSNSNDGTQLISGGNIDLIDFVWDGNFPKKRNWYLRNHTPTTQWVLFLDADEYITDAFKNEVTKRISANDGKVGYWLNYSIYFMGRRLKGGYPLKKLALFKVVAGEYEKIDESNWSSLDMEIHEHPILNGETGVIQSKIDHRDFRGVDHYMIKHQEYASWEAARYQTDINDNEKMRAWTWKQKLKYRLIRSPIIGLFYFFGSYIFMGGFRDGSVGLAFAILKMSYFTQIYCKINESKSLELVK